MALDELARRDPDGPAHRFNEALVKVPPAEPPPAVAANQKRCHFEAFPKASMRIYNRAKDTDTVLL